MGFIESPFPVAGCMPRLPILPREENPEYSYQVEVDATKLNHEKPNVDALSIRIIRIVKEKGGEKVRAMSGRVHDLNKISDFALKQFAIIDDGYFVDNRLEPASAAENFKKSQKLSRKPLFNLSNCYCPLKIYQLKRTYQNSSHEKSDSNKVSKTFWDMQIIDHDSYSPCSRSGHSFIVVPEKKCLYLVGGVTIFAERKYKDCIAKVGDNWFYYPLHDVWKLDLKTGCWEQLLSLDYSLWSKSSKLLAFLGWKSIPKFPDLLCSISLTYDSDRELIYGCMKPVDYRKASERDERTVLFSINPSTRTCVHENDYFINRTAALAIARDYNRLLVIFGDIVYICLCQNPEELGPRGGIDGKSLRPYLEPISFEETLSILKEGIPGLAYVESDLDVFYRSKKSKPTSYVFLRFSQRSKEVYFPG